MLVDFLAIWIFTSNPWNAFMDCPPYVYNDWQHLYDQLDAGEVLTAEEKTRLNAHRGPSARLDEVVAIWYPEEVLRSDVVYCYRHAVKLDRNPFPGSFSPPRPVKLRLNWRLW